MSYKETIAERILGQMKKVGSKPDDYTTRCAHIYSLATGCDYVLNILDGIYDEMWLDTAVDNGRRMFCSLVGLNEFDSEKIKEYISASYTEYALGDMAAALSQYVENCTAQYENGVMTVTLSPQADFSQLLGLGEFLQKYLTPGTTVKLENGDYDFNDYDTLLLSWNEWDKIGDCTFNFSDSFGGD